MRSRCQKSRRKEYRVVLYCGIKGHIPRRCWWPRVCNLFHWLQSYCGSDKEPHQKIKNKSRICQCYKKERLGFSSRCSHSTNRGCHFTRLHWCIGLDKTEIYIRGALSKNTEILSVATSKEYANISQCLFQQQTMFRIIFCTILLYSGLAPYRDTSSICIYYLKPDSCSLSYCCILELLHIATLLLCVSPNLISNHNASFINQQCLYSQSMLETAFLTVVFWSCSILRHFFYV